MSRYLLILAAGLLVLTSACTVGPNYRRPPLNPPAVFRGDQRAATVAQSFGDMHWESVFADPELQALIREALARNYDLQIAAARIEQARARVGIARSGPLPQVSAEVTQTTQGVSTIGLSANGRNQSGSGQALAIGAGASWEIDFWGRFRRATEAARTDLLGAESARRAVTVSLIAEIAAGYLRLRELDSELAVARQSLQVRRNSEELARIREEGGVASLVDVRQAQNLVSTALETITRIEQSITLEENNVNALLGRNPAPISRGVSLESQVLPEIPPGLPSQLLERRPDIRAAEENLIAANANIGVARAAWFPNIGLTAGGGTESHALARLFTGPSMAWAVQPILSVPLFTAGRIRSQVEEAESIRDEYAATYRKAIQNAFRDVSNSITWRQRATELRIQQETLTRNAESAADLSKTRYEGGVTNYLEVLDNERTALSAQLDLAKARLDELLAGVRLYQSLGGGWR